MMATLPPFDPSAKCPKCGHDQVSTRWKKAVPGHIFAHGVPEWLMRHCARCEFNWDEACVSSGGDEPA